MLSRRPGARLNRGRVPDKLPAFSPAALSSLVWWLRADLGVTTAGGKVSAWVNQSGVSDANRNVAQGSAGNRPTYNATDAAYNNQSTISFNETNSEHLLGAGVWSPTYAAPFTFGVVGHTTITGINDASFVGSVGGVADYSDFYQNSSNKVSVFCGSSGTAPAVTSNVAWANKGFALCRVNGASSALYFNTKSHIGTTTGGASFTTTFGSTGINVGKRNVANVEYINGTIAEVFAFSGALSDTDVSNLMDYVAARYAITVTA
jgi:hypothetical protein